MWNLTNRKKQNIALYLSLFSAIVLILLALFAGNLAPHDPIAPNYDRMLEAPSSEFLLGTDQLGRDLFSRLLHGGKTSLMIAIMVTMIVSTTGIILGLIAGYFGSFVDTIIMRIADVLMAFPGTVLILAIISVLGTGLPNLILAMTFSGWTSYARVSRSMVLSLKNATYIEQARLGGASTFKILTTYLLPNIVPSLLVLISQDIGNKLLAIAGLSLLGLGSQPPTPEWGFMLSEGKDYMHSAPWLLYAPGMVVLINVIVFNLLGDCLRDRFDPQST